MKTKQKPTSAKHLIPFGVCLLCTTFLLAANLTVHAAQPYTHTIPGSIAANDQIGPPYPGAKSESAKTGQTTTEAKIAAAKKKVKAAGPSKTAQNKVTYNSSTYTINPDIETTLFMGIDNMNGEQEDGSTDEVLEESGMADSLFLVVLNKVTKESQIIGINRDTIAEVDMYDVNDEYFRTAKLQIALSHGYGDGKELSCLNTVKAVSNLFGGIKIDHYVALKMDAIPMINDEMGGVSVEVLEDMSSADPSFVKGRTIRLKGDQALKYVRYRDTKKLDSNQLRMQRQKQYISAFTEKLSDKTSTDPFGVLATYQKVSKYVVTDLNMVEMQQIFEQFAASKPGDKDFLMVPGKLEEGKFYAEFHADEAALKELTLKIFYEKK